MTLNRQTRLSEGSEPELKSIAEFDYGRSELLETGTFSDFTISCQGVEMKVHRACLMGSSPYFDGVIDSGLAESVNRRLELNQDHPCAVFLVIWYIYTKTYPAMAHSLLDWDGVLDATFLRAAPGDMADYKSHLFLPHLEVYKLADIMMLPKLKAIVFRELRNQLLEFPNSYNPLKQPADMPYTTWSQVPDLKQAIETIYSADDNNLFELRKFFAWSCVYNTANWGYGHTEFEELALRYSQFAWDMYLERDESSPKNIKVCGNCGKGDTTTLNTLVLESNSSFTLLVCKCEYRNFCMEGCLGTPDGFADLASSYCRKCSTGNKKNYDLEYVKRGDAGLELVMDGSFCRLIARDHYLKFTPGN